MKNLKKAGAILVVLVMASAGFGWYLYTKRPPDTRKQPADIVLPADSLLRAFQQNEADAGHNYVDKVILVTGKVTRVQTGTGGEATLFLDAGDPACSVICGFYKEETSRVSKILPGTLVRVKGNCTGILLDVILNKCSLAD